MCYGNVLTFISLASTGMKPTLLSALSTENESWTIKVKVLRLWDSINLSTNEVISADMILADKKVRLLSVYNLNGSPYFKFC
jgi:hypothetical protein